jgi:hypothetical protein
MNPLGNLAGGIMLKLTNNLSLAITKRMKPGTKKSKIVAEALRQVEFWTFHITRLLFTLFIDNPFSELTEEIALSMKSEAPIENSDIQLINGQDIRNRHFHEVLWLNAHNTLHSADTPLCRHSLRSG